MANLTLNISDDLRSRLLARVAESGHANLEQYVQALLESEADAAENDDEDYGAPPHLTVHTVEELEAKLLEGLASGPATEMTRADWDSIRQEVAGRVARRRGPKSA